MLLHLSDLSDEPLQSQIVSQIRAKVLSGDLSAGTDLPSIRALAKSARVSVITVQRAYETLVREELIHSRRGKGFFVSPLEDERKRKMATGRFVDLIRPLIAAAMKEGLTEKEITKALQIILLEIEREKKQ